MTEFLDLLRAAQEGDRDASERMITENSGLIWSVARRYFGRGVEADDLFQLGCVGFIKAIQGFDESFGTQFSTYAVPKIAGEIRRYLRDDGPVKISRALKERAQLIKSTREKLYQVYQREPLLSELAAECGLTPEEIAEANLASEPVESFQRENPEGGFALEDILCGDNPEESLLESIILRETVDALPERERSVILLRYYRNLTQEKTAKVLNTSQVQVSRIEQRAMKALRESLSG